MKPTKAEMREAASEQTSPERLTELAARDKTLARVVASNCAAPGELLDTLSGHPDKAVRKRVVRNPAALAGTVARAGGEFPSDLLDNPAFDLYLIEEPDLLTDFGEATLRALLKRETCPLGFFAYAARRGDTATQLALLMNPAATSEAIDIIRESVEGYQAPAWIRPGSLIEACDLHRSIARNVDWRARLSAGLEQARGGDRPKPEQFALAEVSLMLDSATAETLGQQTQAGPISHVLFSSLHIDLATNPATPAQVLASLSQNENADVRKAVAKNQSTGPEILSVLAADNESFEVRKAVALNPKTPSEILHVLAHDVEIFVQNAVARNSSTTSDLLEILAFSQDERFQKEAQIRLAVDRSTPFHVLQKISLSTDRDVLSALISNSAATAEILNGPLERLVGKYIRDDVAVAAHRHSPAHVLESLAEKKYKFSESNSLIRSSLAGNRSLPPHLFATLLAEGEREEGEDERAELRATIAANRACPEGVLRALATDDSITVRQAVYSNRSAPPDLKKALKESLDLQLNESYLIDEWIGDNLWRAAGIPSALIPSAIFEALACNDDAVVRRIVAKKIRNSQPVLEALSKDASAGVRYAVAGNRATPPHVLEALAEDQNPCVRWMVADNSVAPPALRSSMLRGPAGFRDWFRGNVNRLLANDDNTPPHVLEILASDYDNHVRFCVAYNKTTPSRALEMLARDDDSQVREGVVGHPTTPSQALEILARDDDSQVRQRVSSHPNISSQALEILARDDDSEVRHDAASHPSIPPQSLEILARNEDASVRRGVARNPNAPVRLLDLLARDDDSEVRHDAASHPNIPPQSLEILARNEDASVRGGVARNPNAPERLLDLLASDEDKDVRGGVARNPNAPERLLDLLASDEDKDVRWAVALNPNAPERSLDLLARDRECKVRLLVARHPTNPSQALEILASDEDKDVRWAVARNPNAPERSLDLLARDGECKVRRLVAGHPTTHPQALEILASDEDKDVRWAVAQNWTTPPGLLQSLALDEVLWVKRAAKDALKRRLGKKLTKPSKEVKELEHKLLALGGSPVSGSPEWELRKLLIDLTVEAARNPYAPVDQLNVLARDEDIGVRVEVARNPSTSANLLARLALDSARLVRANAACNPAYAGTASGGVAVADGFQPTFRLGFTNVGRTASKRIEAAKAAADPIAAGRELKVGWIKDLTRTTQPGISRLAALAQPECPPDALARAQRSSWWLERCVIAANPGTPLSALRGLAKDGNAVVQAAALEALAGRGESMTG